MYKEFVLNLWSVDVIKTNLPTDALSRELRRLTMQLEIIENHLDAAEIEEKREIVEKSIILKMSDMTSSNINYLGKLKGIRKTNLKKRFVQAEINLLSKGISRFPQKNELRLKVIKDRFEGIVHRFNKISA